ncbi:MAG: hypothetical protein HY617_02275 [Candidatus Sungbacteria bacterium]|nr:hypothetical protein [Candidatus Sungbacteria bacterium]
MPEFFTPEDVQLRPRPKPSDKIGYQTLYCICCTRSLAVWEAVCIPAYIGCCEQEKCQNFAREQAAEIANLIKQYKEEHGIERIGHVLVLAPSRPSALYWFAAGQSRMLALMRKVGDLVKIRKGSKPCSG